MPSNLLTFEQVENYVTDSRTAVKNYVSQGLDDGEIADLADLLRREAAWAGEQKRMLISELDTDIPNVGTRSSVTIPDVCKRSYSTEQILMGVLEENHDLSLLDVLKDAIANDAVKFTWGWRKLKKWLNSMNVTMTVAPFEISDGDEFMVGEEWTRGSAKFESVK